MFPQDYFGHAYFPTPYFPSLAGAPIVIDTTGIDVRDLRSFPMFYIDLELPLEYNTEDCPMLDDGRKNPLYYVQSNVFVIYNRDIK